MNAGPLAATLAAAACFVGIGGCAHLSTGSVAPLPTASATPIAAACNASAATNAQIVAISPLITPTSDPVYGVIAGYGLVSGGTSSNVAAPVVVGPSATIQFFNDDQAGSQLRYSAAGIPGVAAFPGPTYTFPPSASAQSGTQINASSSWSTGFLAGQCYSQTFTIGAPGTYYFGDVTYYGLGNLRDVIVATSTP
jgi:hypothetical protein